MESISKRLEHNPKRAEHIRFDIMEYARRFVSDWQLDPTNFVDALEDNLLGIVYVRENPDHSLSSVVGWITTGARQDDKSIIVQSNDSDGMNLQRIVNEYISYRLGEAEAIFDDGIDDLLFAGVLHVLGAASMNVGWGDTPDTKQNKCMFEIVFADYSMVTFFMDVTGRVDMVISTHDLPIPHGKIAFQDMRSFDEHTRKSFGIDSDSLEQYEANGMPQLLRLMSAVITDDHGDLELLA